MSFELPDLDTRSSVDLQTALLRRIPQFTRLWTDYNDSDPGITLLQMLCWISESLLYQTNAIPIETEQNFLRDVLGLAFTSNQTAYSDAATQNYDFAFQALTAVLGQIENGAALTRAQLQLAVLDYLNTPYMALSLDDVQALAYQANQMILAQQAPSDGGATMPLLVQRADALVRGEATALYVLSNAKWAYRLVDPTDISGAGASNGKRSMLVLQPPTGADATKATNAQKTLLSSVSNYVAPRVLLGSRVNVQAAQLTDINLSVIVSCSSNVVLKTVLTALTNTLFGYFQPNATWRYNQPPVLDDVQLLIERVPGVLTVDSLVLSYAPTAQMGWLGQLDVNALIADLPPGTPGLLYRGLPRVRCLSLLARSVA